jgi:hypothetical protein
MRLHPYQNILQLDDTTIAVTIYTVINEQEDIVYKYLIYDAKFSRSFAITPIIKCM